jgi:hypothetical protein
MTEQREEPLSAARLQELRRAVTAMRTRYHEAAVMIESSPEYQAWLVDCSLNLRPLLHIAEVLLDALGAPNE